jgi:hypothetical protein
MNNTKIHKTLLALAIGAVTHSARRRMIKKKTRLLSRLHLPAISNPAATSWYRPS